MEQAPAFIFQLRHIVDCGKYLQVITWTQNGQGIEILDEKEFVETAVVDTFRHRNFNSFIRQLNVYGFRKAERNLDTKVYFHPYFTQSQPHLDRKIVRKPRKRSRTKNHLSEVKRGGFLQENPVDSKYLIQRLPSLSSILPPHLIN